jgi:hypothetical protein
VKYYEKQGVTLYTPCFHNKEHPNQLQKMISKYDVSGSPHIPFIVNNTRQDFIDLKTTTEPLIEPGHKHKKTLTKQQKRLIKKRKNRTKQKIQNNKTLCLGEGIYNNKIYYTECDYYDLAGCMLEYDRETYKAVNNRFAKTPLRDTFLATISKIKRSTKKRRISLGGSVATCFKSKEGTYKLLLHTRSKKVMTDRGKKTVVPQFGFEPLLDGLDAFSEPLYEHNKLIVYNIIREFCEELYNREELVNNIKSGCTLDKFSDIPEVQNLKALFEDKDNDKKLRIIFLGHGFEVVFGAKILCFLLLIDDQAALTRFYKQREKNWEINDLEEIELNAEGISQLEEYQQNKALTPYASFTISRALEWLRGNP